MVKLIIYTTYMQKAIKAEKINKILDFSHII